MEAVCASETLVYFYQTRRFPPCENEVQIVAWFRPLLAELFSNLEDARVKFLRNVKELSERCTE
jgi:hypothetical protein